MQGLAHLRFDKGIGPVVVCSSSNASADQAQDHQRRQEVLFPKLPQVLPLGVLPGILLRGILKSVTAFNYLRPQGPARGVLI